MKHMASLALVCSMTACGVSPEEARPSEAEGEGEDVVAPVVLNIGIDQLAVARFDLDLGANIARFTEPAARLPLDRVSIFMEHEPPEDLSDALARCNELWGYEVTGGAEFVVGQGESDITELGVSSCISCGFAVICPGTCRNLGPGEIPRSDPSAYDTDPVEGDTGVDNGGSSGTGDSGGASGSGAGSGGHGGASGGVGQPGGWD